MRPEAPSWQSTASDLAEPPPAAAQSAVSWLAEPRIVIGLILSYLFGHFALRLALSPTLGIDDAEQVLFAQQWAFGYRFRQPPLFTWLLLPVIDVVGPGVLAVSVVRYALLAVTYIFFYLTARLCLRDQRMAGLAALSPLMIYVFAYYAHQDLTHTTALGAVIALALYITARLAKNPGLDTYLALGTVFGLGMLAKWNFAILALSVPLACLILPSFRHLVLTWKSLPAIAVMTVIVTPTALWMFAQGQSIEAVSSDILAREGNTDHIALLVEGGGALLSSILLFPLPFLPLFLIVFMPNLRARANGAHDTSRPSLTPAFLGSMILIALALHALLIPLFGAVNFTERWLHPALMALPIYLFALAERGRPTDRRIIAFLTILAILVAAAAGARLYRHVAGADDCGKCREFAPFAELADGLRAAGFSRGTIVADGMHIGGNLKMLFADSRVIDPDFPRSLWPDVDDAADRGSCLLAWRDDGERSQKRRDFMRSYARQELGLPETISPKSGRLDSFLLGSSTRRYTLAFELYQENAGGCR